MKSIKKETDLSIKSSQRGKKIAYMMSRFPKITETFILYEILALKKKGISVDIYPLLKEASRVVHPGVKEVMEKVHYLSFFSLPTLFAQLYFLYHTPGVYLKLLIEILQKIPGNLHFLSKVIILFPKMVRLARKMQKQNIDHIHAHFATHPAITAMVIKRLTGISFSFTAHGSDIHVKKHQCMLGKCVEAADFVRTVSHYNKQFIVDICGESVSDKIHVIHCGIDVEVFSYSIKAASEDFFRIICVGTFREVKGHQYLIEACRLLKNRGGYFRCHLVGEGPLQRQLEKQIAQSGLEEDFILHGAIQREKVAELLQASNVLTLPSVLTARGDREGIPVAIMEAMAVGIAVVSSQLSGIPELVENGITGILVEPRNSEQLADAFERLIQSPDLCHTMGKAGREKVLSEFKLSDNIEQLLELLLNYNPQ